MRPLPRCRVSARSTARRVPGSVKRSENLAVGTVCVPAPIFLQLVFREGTHVILAFNSVLLFPGRRLPPAWPIPAYCDSGSEACRCCSGAGGEYRVFRHDPMALSCHTQRVDTGLVQGGTDYAWMFCNVNGLAFQECRAHHGQHWALPTLIIAVCFKTMN